MRSWRLLAAPVLFVCAAQSAAANDNAFNEAKGNVTINQSQIDAAAVEHVLARVDEIRSGADTRAEVSIDEVLAVLPLTTGERATVAAAHPAPMPVSCSGDICTAVSDGDEVYLNLSMINNMRSWFDRHVVLKLRWRGPTKLELCNVKGFQVKQVFWVPIDGAVIDSQGAEGSSFVDVSVGGSFPDC